MNAEEDYSSSYESYPSVDQEYIPIPTRLKCNQVLASYKADLPPVFQLQAKDEFYARGAVQQSKLLQIKNLTRRPARAVPPNALSSWKELTPDVKLPDIRHRTLGEIYYTRGKVGQKLHVGAPEYDLSDPVNRRKVLDLNKYSALHDPHLKGYFNRPNMLKHLRKQKLINDKREVLCDVHEFNKYRSYLGELFNDQVKNRITDNNEMEDMERQLIKSLCARQQQKKLSDRKAFQVRHQKLSMAYAEAVKNRHLARIRIWDRRLQEIERYRSQVKLARTGMYTMKHWNAYMTRQKASKAEEHKKQHTLIRIAYAETKNDYVTKYDKFVRLALFERYKADQAAVLIARDDQIDDMEELVQETLRRTRSTWLKKYDNFILQCRENPLSHYQFMMQALIRRKYLLRKYFYKWIQFVVKQRKMRPNPEHESVFRVEKKLKPFVQSLKGFSPSDFELGAACGAGDYECKQKQGQKLTKLRSLGKMFPRGSRAASLSNVKIVEKQKGYLPNVEIETEKKKKKRKKKKVEEDDDGNEADVEETDNYIDKMVARYKLEQEELKKKLVAIPPSRLSTLGYSYYVPKKLQTVRTFAGFDQTQEDQGDTVVFLKDATDTVGRKSKLKAGWRAMKL